jgi:hypothetical protein
MNLTSEALIESLDEVIDFLNEIRAAAATQPATEEDTNVSSQPSAPSFSSQCIHCGGAIHWAVTLRNGKKVALDQRSGSYSLTAEGKAVWTAGDRQGYAYHYDGSLDGCRSARGQEKPDARQREWQDKYD